MADQLAVMRGVRYGRWGIHAPGLFFETWLPDNSATLQLLFGKAARRLLAQAGISTADADELMAQPGNGGAEVAPLEGRACYVKVDGFHVTFKRLAAVS
jgi:hypothetical protein